ncbi:MAG: head GIN domain-containing protein [Anaerolineales bacterium]|nr:head GIN domain-containing protein [Anaerolineales bacterium]
MNKAMLGTALFAAALTLSCGLFSTRATGNIITQNRDLADFDKIEAGNAFELEITQGEAYDVVIRVDEAYVDDLQVTKDGRVLKIGLNPNSGLGSINGTLEAEITMPELVELDLSGSSDATVAGFESSEPFYASLSGNSSLQGSLEAGDTRFEASGNSTIELSGSGGYATAIASGNSDIDLASFPVNNATAEAGGSSTLILNVTGNLDAEASGGSDIYYIGDPNLGVVTETGGSSVRPR